MNNKQDRAYARTAADLERKYNFGKTFAEVFGLIDGVKDDTEQAIKELDQALNHDEIFNRLTNYGKVQGIYRENDNIYINASYIKSGKLAADYIDADNLKVNAANITGSLTITQLPNDVAKTSQLPKNLSDLSNDVGYQNATGVTEIVGGSVTTDFVSALGISVDTLEGGTIYLVGSWGNPVATFELNDASNTQNRKLDINAPAIAITSTITEGNVYRGVNGAGYFQLNGNHAYFGTMDSWASTSNGYRPSIRPATDNAYEIGGLDKRWKNIYAANGVIQTSDRRKKRDIEYGLSQYDGFFDRLRPSSYKLVGGDRTHTGLVAQDIESLLAECGIDTMDFAGFVKSEREDGTGYDYGLRYSEFIPLLIEQVQNLKARVHNIETGGSPNGRH